MQIGQRMIWGKPAQTKWARTTTEAHQRHATSFKSKSSNYWHAHAHALFGARLGKRSTPTNCIFLALFSLYSTFSKCFQLMNDGWGKHMMNIHFWGSHTLAFDWILLLQHKTCIRSSYKWNPLLTKASICHKLGFLHAQLRKECISFLIPFLILF